MNIIYTYVRSEELAEYTLPHLMNYADRIGADLSVARRASAPTTREAYMKEAVMCRLRGNELLDDYEKVAYFDTGVLVLDGAPNLFVHDLALFEGKHDGFGSYVSTYNHFSKDNIVPSGQYYDTDIMVMSAKVFSEPKEYICLARPEADHFNYEIQRKKLNVVSFEISDRGYFVFTSVGSDTEKLMIVTKVKEIE